MAATSATATVGTSPLRVASASFIGTTVEYYDFLIYGTAAALVFPRLFFPDVSPATGLLLSFATFGVGFVARPLGGIVFGHYGDRVGRKRMLVYSLLIMGTATVLMGALPTYAQIGVAAPILLTLLRLAQGFAVGGEWGGATLMAVEHATPDRKGLYGAFPQMGAPAGTATATLAFYAVSLLPDEQFLSWGWRIPFLASAVLIVIGLVIRLSLAESPEFAAVQARAAVLRLPIAVAFRRHWRQILLVAGAYLSQGVFAYICVAYLVSYATTVAGIDRAQALLGVCVAAVVAVVMYPVFGRVSDAVGRKPVFLAGVIAMGMSVLPVFALINTGRPGLFLLALVLVFGLAMAPAAGVTGSLFSLAFDADVRYSGVSLGYTLSAVVGSAFAPTIATALYAATESSDSIAAYMIAVSVISAVSVSLMPGPWRQPRVR
ncbi:MFS transporter [Mycolicibacterium monacense]|uniref:Putative proline/betaine transporter n=4 Tax=Mycobacteriaceae TaxID=1762 RepID=A0AAD1IST8_MYCMB|nr:MFS transporter [Mycolicibacterium monacense]MDA4103034.1 MFS transporter [Mycolicibacterium monacense DSM 44395]OBB77794.1 MFS transporter [Mycolicibacterium monacense]ORB18046.1 MFS transporter [Mycolicibacterium monacense DSM 44395]QHP87387.1 MFS transporter [Mycolicibacterium monacense DSM 44395]BBZ59488.1 MFS transporter [Mycolicibacterium monacense]